MMPEPQELVLQAARSIRQPLAGSANLSPTLSPPRRDRASVAGAALRHAVSAPAHQTRRAASASQERRICSDQDGITKPSRARASTPVFFAAPLRQGGHHDPGRNRCASRFQGERTEAGQVRAARLRRSVRQSSEGRFRRGCVSPGAAEPRSLTASHGLDLAEVGFASIAYAATKVRNFLPLRWRAFLAEQQSGVPFVLRGAPACQQVRRRSPPA